MAKPIDQYSKYHIKSNVVLKTIKINPNSNQVDAFFEDSDNSFHRCIEEDDICLFNTNNTSIYHNYHLESLYKPIAEVQILGKLLNT